MRGYYRPIPDLKSFPTPAKTRDQIEQHIADGFPSPVEYAVQGGPLPVNLKRSSDDEQDPEA